MAIKPYDWKNGAKLDEHSKRKHKILREYFHQYLLIRCQNPAQTRFRLAVVDGFSGAGRYKCGSAGSPLIFIEELERAVNAVNLRRVARGLNSTIDVDCLLIFNDASSEAIKLLQQAVEPAIFQARQSCPRLHLRVLYLNDEFQASYATIKAMIAHEKYRSILFNLDQCGHSKVTVDTLSDIMTSTPSAEIFYTFAIQTLLTYLSRTNGKLLKSQLASIGVDPSSEGELQAVIAKDAWLGAAERLVYEAFKNIAPFHSPFSITNPEGWRYWLIHFANSYRARQVYNDILHGNGTQAHFGRSGLNMLSYDPSEGSLFQFEEGDRLKAKDALLEDIPRVVSELGDALLVGDFYETAYNVTPAHSDDIHAAMIDSDELEIITPTGGRRRTGGTIGPSDTIKLKSQRTLFTYSSAPKRKK